MTTIGTRASDAGAGTGESAGATETGESLLRRAIGAQEKGEHARAVGLFQRAIEAEPHNWVAHTCLGNTLRALRRLDEAIAAQRRAVELSADPRALSNLALGYRDAGRLDDAIAALGQAIAVAPGVAELHQNLSGLLLEADRPDRATLAEAAARRALALDPRQARAETNLGCALKELGDRSGAEGSFRRAIALDAGDADAHWNLGLTLLGAARSVEEEVEGWREIEWRQRIPGLRTPPPASGDAASRPLWRGEPLHGRTLLLQAEQGLGDTLQLVRYARQVKAVAGAGRVVVECQPPLRRLLAGCDGADQIVAAVRSAGPSPGTSLASAGARSFPRFDVRAPLFSLPALLGGRAMDGGPETPYLRADPERIRRWRAIIDERAAERVQRLGRPWLRARAPFTIGIAWQGNRRYRADRRRSIPLVCFAPLFEAAARLGACVFTLQKGDGREQLGALPATAPVDDLAADLDLEAEAGADAGAAFLDTAAAMCALDLIITSDTAIPHLGGALGRPVWLLLSHLPDWRWGQGGAGQRCRWYRRTRLFRQERPDDWAGVFARVTRALSEAIGP